MRRSTASRTQPTGYGPIKLSLHLAIESFLKAAFYEADFKSSKMKFKMPRYEVKYFNEKAWRNISEEGFLSHLLENHDPITPVLSKIFEGEEIATSGAIYRIKNNIRTDK